MDNCKPIPYNRQKEDSINIHENILNTLTPIKESDNEATSPEKSKRKSDDEANSPAKNGHEINDYINPGDKKSNDPSTREDVPAQKASQVETKPSEFRFNRLTADRKSYKEGSLRRSLLHKL